MAGIGPPPRDNKDARILTETGTPHGPELPDPAVALSPGETWHPMTVEWWDSLRRHPLLAREPAIGWSDLFIAASLHHKMWEYGRTDLLAELRLRMASYAITPADRQRMQIAVVSPVEGEGDAPAGEDATVVRMKDRRKRLIG